MCLSGCKYRGFIKSYQIIFWLFSVVLEVCGTPILICLFLKGIAIQTRTKNKEIF
jgi:hypothetical protein